MATTSKTGHEPVQTDFLFTYGTGSIKSPIALRAISPAELYQELSTEHQKQHAWWATQGSRTFKQYERWLKRRPRPETIFPHIIPGVAFRPEASLADEENIQADPQNLSGLLVISFNCYNLEWDAEGATKRRESLWNSLLDTPLLGPSIVTMFNELDRRALHVLVAVEATHPYSTSVKTVVNYLKTVDHPLAQSLRNAPTDPLTTYWVGSDPLARIQHPSAGSYQPFPIKQAQAIIDRKKLEEWFDQLEQPDRNTKWMD